MKKGLLYISLLLMSGCYYDVADELYPNAGNANCDTSSGVYSPKISGIIANSCAISGCHVAGGTDPDLSDSTIVYDKIDRIQVRAINDKTMPPSAPLSKCDIKTLQNWINAGTP